jgi:hypothetical protein
MVFQYHFMTNRRPVLFSYFLQSVLVAFLSTVPAIRFAFGFTLGCTVLRKDGSNVLIVRSIVRTRYRPARRLRRPAGRRSSVILLLGLFDFRRWSRSL